MPEDGVAEPTPTLPSPQETCTKSIIMKSAESLDVLENNHFNEVDDYSKLIFSITKYECPVCDVFEVEEKESFRKHLLKEINSSL